MGKAKFPCNPDSGSCGLSKCFSASANFSGFLLAAGAFLHLLDPLQPLALSRRDNPLPFQPATSNKANAATNLKHLTIVVEFLLEDIAHTYLFGSRFVSFGAGLNAPITQKQATPSFLHERPIPEMTE